MVIVSIEKNYYYQQHLQLRTITVVHGLQSSLCYFVDYFGNHCGYHMPAVWVNTPFAPIVIMNLIEKDDHHNNH